MKQWVVSFLAVAAGAGCAFNEDLVEGEASQALKSQCDDWFCGQNTPVVFNRGFSDLRLDGLENAQGFAITSFKDKTGTPWNLHVEGATIFGTNADATQVMFGQNLIGSRIGVRYHDGSTYTLEITEVAGVKFWAHSAQFPYASTPSYRIKWASVDPTGVLGEYADLCANPEVGDKYGQVLGMDVHRTLVFSGDRFDSVTKTVTGYDPNYFNLGCAGSLLAKMHLTGHTTAAASWGFSTTTAEKTAMMKMLSADYCGDGSAFTVAGEPLLWADDRKTMTVGDGKGDVEARWSDKGAICLNKPRVVVNPTDLSKQTFGWDYDAFEAELIATCGGKDRVPPPCTDNELVAKPGHLVSVNPYLSK